MWESCIRLKAVMITLPIIQQYFSHVVFYTQLLINEAHSNPLTNNDQSMFGTSDRHQDLMTVSDKAQMVSNPSSIWLNSCFVFNTPVRH